MYEFAGPLDPTLVFEAFAKTVKEDEVFEPPTVLPRKLVEAFAVASGGAAMEFNGSFTKEREFSGGDSFEIDASVTVWQRAKAIARNESALSQAVEADEKCVSGKGRGRGVG
jgi:mannose-6-phosphate isomerase-like protein (cupin superfamily)